MTNLTTCHKYYIRDAWEKYCSKEKHVFVLRIAFLADLHKASVVIPDNKLTWDHDTVSLLPEAQPSQNWPQVRGKPIMKWEGRRGEQEAVRLIGLDNLIRVQRKETSFPGNGLSVWKDRAQLTGCAEIAEIT